MSFPSSPINGQLAVINNITYVYSSTTNSWTRQQHTFNNTGPVPPTTNLLVGDIWYNTNDDTVYRYTYDGTSYYWVDIITPTVTTSTTNLNFGTITSNTFTSNTVNTTAVYANSYYFANGSSLTTGSSVPKITSVQVTNASYVANGWQAVSNTGGYIIINGTGFVSGANVVIGTKTVTGTYVSSTLMQVPVPAQTNGYYTVYVVNPDGGVAINVPGLIYNDVPIFTTGATLPGAVNGSSVSIQLFATDSQSLTYSLASGSLPPGLTLSSSGLISGTITGVTSATVYNFAVTVTDIYSQVAQQTFNISVSVGDTYFPYTSLLLSASTNSANTSGNTSANTVIDSSYNYNNIIRAGGNPGQGTFNPFGTNWSNYFGGTGNYLQTNSTPISASLSTFTIETWVYMTAAPTGAQPAVIGDMQANGTGSNYWSFGVNSSNQVAFYWYAGSGNSVAGSTTMSLNTWYHIAISVNNNAISMYVNGTLQTLTGTTTLSIRTSSLNYLVLSQCYGGTAGLFTGYISNLRIVAGTALYSATFTPPTAPLSVVANTVLLTCQSNRFIDANTTPTTITSNTTGAMSVQRFNPFGVNGVPYNTSANTYIGSTYFGGNGNYLYTSNPQFNISSVTLNWTFECWLYPISSGNFAAIGNGGTYGNSFFATWGVVSNAFTLGQGIGNSGQPTAQTSSSYPGNTWYHIALTRNGTSGQTTFWVNGANAASFNYTSSSFSSGTTFLLNGVYDNNGLGNAGGTFYISNARFVANTVLYNSNFIPQANSPLTSISNTIILTAQSSQTVTYDANTTPNSITVGGTPRPTKNIPFSQSWAGQFNGSTSYLSIPYNAGLVYGTNNFTVEAWIYPTATIASQQQIIGSFESSAAWQLYVDNLNRLSFSWTTNGSYNASFNPTSGSVITANTWSHIAAVRNGGTVTIYLNGVSQANAAISGSIFDPARPFKIGNRLSDQWFLGYISNVRIVNGTAVYTSNFTPANTPLTAIANTVLLTCQNGSNSNTFIDNSTNAFTITNNGTPGANVVTMATPGYSPMPLVDSSLAATIYSGSYYFNGSTDVLTLSSLGLYSTNFTIEAWIYLTSYPGSQGGIIYTTYHLGQTQTAVLIFYVTTTGALIFNNGQSNITSSTTMAPNTWHHVAATYTSSSNTAQIYIDGISQGTGTIPVTQQSGTTWIGGDPGDNNIGSAWFPGYISNLRATKGILYSGSTFTPPTAPFNPSANIAYSGPANTVLLLSGTNVGAYDSTMINDFINIGGVSVTSNVKYGTTSYYFNGTSSYLTSTTNLPFVLGTGDFTIECWIYTNSSATQRIISTGNAGGTPYEFVLVNSSSNIYVDFFDGTTDITTGSNYVPQNQWVHLAVTRQSSAVKLFINGVVSGTGTTSVNLTSNGTPTIGRYSQAASGYFSGNIQDLRITKGVARYTANFTVPSTPFIAQ